MNNPMSRRLCLGDAGALLEDEYDLEQLGRLPNSRSSDRPGIDDDPAFEEHARDEPPARRLDSFR